MNNEMDNWFAIYLLPGFVFQSLVIAGGEIGLVELIAKGYGFMILVFILVFVIPVMTFGVVRIVRRPTRGAIGNLLILCENLEFVRDRPRIPLLKECDENT